jgi:hypothetical protein
VLETRPATVRGMRISDPGQVLGVLAVLDAALSSQYGPGRGHTRCSLAVYTSSWLAKHKLALVHTHNGKPNQVKINHTICGE